MILIVHISVIDLIDSNKIGHYPVNYCKNLPLSRKCEFVIPICEWNNVKLCSRHLGRDIYLFEGS